MVQTITAAMRAKAEKLAERVPFFPRGRSKVNGQEFVIVPGTKPNSACWTNGLGGTCEGNRRRGVCSHSVAVQMVVVRESEKRIAAAQFKPCRVDGCPESAFGKAGWCREHLRELADKIGV